MQFTLRTAAVLLATLQLHASSVLAAPTAAPADAVLEKRKSILDDTPGDLKGDDLKAWNACSKLTADENGFSCLDFGGHTQKDGCLAAEVTIQKPCENKAVQARLTEIYCQDNPGGKFC